MRELGIVPAEDLLRRVTEHFAESLVGNEDSAVRRDVQDSHRGLLKSRPESRLALAEFFLDWGSLHGVGYRVSDEPEPSDIGLHPGYLPHK